MFCVLKSSSNFYKKCKTCVDNLMTNMILLKSCWQGPDVVLYFSVSDRVWGIKNTEHKRLFPICILNYHKTSKQLTFVFWDLRSYRMTAMAKQTYCKAVKVSNTTQQSNAVSRKPYFQSIIHALTPSRTSILPNNTTDEFNMLCWFFFSQGR